MGGQWSVSAVLGGQPIPKWVVSFNGRAQFGNWSGPNDARCGAGTAQAPAPKEGSEDADDYDDLRWLIASSSKHDEKNVGQIEVFLGTADPALAKLVRHRSPYPTGRATPYRDPFTKTTRRHLRLHEMGEHS